MLAVMKYGAKTRHGGQELCRVQEICGQGIGLQPSVFSLLFLSTFDDQVAPFGSLLL